MLKFLQHKYALSPKGAKDMVKAFGACFVFYLSLMFPVGLLYYLVGDLLNGTALGGRTAFYTTGIICCLVLIFFTCYIQYKATFFSTYVESGVRRISLAERLRKLPLSFFGRKDLSDLTSTIMSDCATLETASSHWIPELIGSMLSTLLVAIGLFCFDWRMALAALWVLPVSFAVVIFSSRFMHTVQMKQMGYKMDCADGIQECLESVRDLKANNAENQYMAGLDKKIKAVEKYTIVTELFNALFNGSARMILKLGIATTALVGSILLANGSLNILTFFMFLLVVSRMYDPMMASLDNLSAIIATNIQSERMNEILEHPMQTGSETLTNKGCDIKFDHVGFAYHKDEPILRDVSFTAKQGQVTALIGPSGSGKTTVSRLIARFWDITKGKITVGGMDISTIDPETLLSLYSIVFQDVTLFNNTIMENIRIGRKDATDAEVIHAAKLAHCDEFAKKLPNSWNSQIGENGCELSGGERQRISLARAFLKNAPIILLDEATASLDVENETMIQESLSRLIQNKTVIIIAHRMRTVAGADHIVVLNDGVVAQQGNPNILMQQEGIYRKMSHLQMQAQKWKMA
ncbi:MAG: ABC transporter ATP-binding protein/permease [Oscillospiraceae bacterium]|jgi:ATP-binding cassette subfamily B protein|nr:ABC transporter ATP-binding protein/permease [Oscillospiraceae bacterium]